MTREGTQLFAQATGQPRFALTALSETEFAPTAFEARLVFEAGDPTPAATLFQGAAEMHAPRVEAE